MMDFLPAGRVTGIGSLPHLDADEAVRFVREFSSEIPFWPQLPQRSPAESMIPQMLPLLLDLLEAKSPSHYEIKPNQLKIFLQRLRESDAKLSEESASGFFAFERACHENYFSNAVTLKAQISGPITLGWCLFYKDSPLSTLPDLYIEIAGYLCRLARWQISRLKQFGKSIILFIDEPMLEMESSKAYLTDGVQQLIETIHSERVTSGIHCCATPAPVSLCSLQPDIISFDAHYGLEAFLSHSETRQFIESGRCLSFGLVPTWDTPEKFSPSESIVRWASVADEYTDIQTLATRSLVTATCGLGLLTVEAAQASFVKARELSQLIAKIIGT